MLRRPMPFSMSDTLLFLVGRLHTIVLGQVRRGFGMGHDINTTPPKIISESILLTSSTTPLFVIPNPLFEDWQVKDQVLMFLINST